MNKLHVQVGKKYQCRKWGQIVTCRVIEKGLLMVTEEHEVEGIFGGDYTAIGHTLYKNIIEEK